MEVQANQQTKTTEIGRQGGFQPADLEVNLVCVDADDNPTREPEHDALCGDVRHPGLAPRRIRSCAIHESCLPIEFRDHRTRLHRARGISLHRRARSPGRHSKLVVCTRDPGARRNHASRDRACIRESTNRCPPGDQWRRSRGVQKPGALDNGQQVQRETKGARIFHPIPEG